MLAVTLLALVLESGSAALPAGAADTPGLQAIDGGPAYWSRFSDPLPSDPGFFPISVWFESVQTPRDTQLDKAAGINTYLQLTANTDLSLVRAAGMHAIHDGGPPGAGSETNGWLVADEADMWGGPGSAAWTGHWPGEGDICSPASAKCGYTVMNTLDGRLPGDGRMRHAHYGKGVAFWETDAEAAQFLNNFEDSVATDVYWFTDDDACVSSQGGGSPGVNTSNSCHVAANYGWLVQRERDLISPHASKPVWGIVELGHPFSENGWPTITPAETRAAVWHSLIAGARGIVYFNHSFGGSCQTQHLLRDPCYSSMRSAVTELDQQVTDLAPVLNAPFVTSGWSQGAGTKAMVKWSGGRFYVFAGSAGSGTTGSFSIPCVGGATATVLGENRSVPVAGGAFSDAFADGNAIHIYRIDGGSDCGLPADAAGAQPGGTTGARPAAGRTARVWRVTPSRRSLRSGRLTVRVTCTAKCTVRSRLSSRVLLASAHRRFAAAGKHEIVLRLSRRARLRVARARKPLPLRLRTTITEARGNVSRLQRLVVTRPRR